MRLLRVFLIVIATILLILLIGPFLIPIPDLSDTVDPLTLVDDDSLFMEVNGINVHYKQTGHGDTVMILLHGFGSSTYSWREVMGPLSHAGTVLAYDRPAFGLTERPLPGEWNGESPYSPQAQVDILFGLMDQLGIEKAILVGNSAGGAVAMNAALAKPERIQALVLVDAAVYEGGGISPFLRLLFQIPQMDRLGILLARSISTRGMDILYSAWHDQAKLTPEIIENYRKPLRVKKWDVALWQLTKASRSLALTERLEEFEMPVLVVSGDDDRIVTTENSVRLANEIPGSRLVIFEQCGHVPQEECPQAFLKAVQPFIEQIQ